MSNQHLKYTEVYIRRILEAVQTLEDMGGPEPLEQYIAVLSAVRLDIEERINAATDRMIEELGL
jgi:hypothetical protein